MHRASLSKDEVDAKLQVLSRQRRDGKYGCRRWPHSGVLVCTCVLLCVLVTGLTCGGMSICGLSPVAGRAAAGVVGNDLMPEAHRRPEQPSHDRGSGERMGGVERFRARSWVKPKARKSRHKHLWKGQDEGRPNSPVGLRLFNYLDGFYLDNGVIDWVEMAPFCLMIGWKLTTAEALFLRHDTDQSGGLSASEFLLLSARPELSPVIVRVEALQPDVAPFVARFNQQLQYSPMAMQRPPPRQQIPSESEARRIKAPISPSIMVPEQSQSLDPARVRLVHETKPTLDSLPAQGGTEVADTSQDVPNSSECAHWT